MRPAFSSTKQAAGFTLLLLLVLLSPVLAGKKYLPPREESYATASLNLGCYPFIHQAIYKEKGDVDIAFVGPSQVWTAINTPYVQRELTKKLGRKASVLTLGWNWSGFDAIYFITKDLLLHRKVHMLVINQDYTAERPLPHEAAQRWFRFGDNWGDLAGLSLPCQMAYYGEALRGMPGNILSMVRQNLPVEWTAPRDNYSKFCLGASSVERLGSLSIPYGFGYFFGDIAPYFEEYSPVTDVPPAAVCVYSPETKDRFQFADVPTSQDTLFFLRKLAVLAQANNVKLVWLHIPKATEERAPTVPEIECWPRLLPGSITLIGIPPAAFLAGMSDSDVLKLFYNNAHMNKNGQEYFTRAITPALLNLYVP
jgi:hypothetical protein